MDHLHLGDAHCVKPLIFTEFMRRQEDFITDNRNLIFSIIGRMHSQEENRNNEYAFILETLHSQKRKIESLQAECVSL
jgi:hypothetical protein